MPVNKRTPPKAPKPGKASKEKRASTAGAREVESGPPTPMIGSLFDEHNGEKSLTTKATSSSSHPSNSTKASKKHSKKSSASNKKSSADALPQASSSLSLDTNSSNVLPTEHPNDLSSQSVPLPVPASSAATVSSSPVKRRSSKSSKKGNKTSSKKTPKPPRDPSPSSAKTNPGTVTQGGPLLPSLPLGGLKASFSANKSSKKSGKERRSSKKDKKDHKNDTNQNVTKKTTKDKTESNVQRERSPGAPNIRGKGNTGPKVSQVGLRVGAHDLQVEESAHPARPKSLIPRRANTYAAKEAKHPPKQLTKKASAPLIAELEPIASSNSNAKHEKKARAALPTGGELAGSGSFECSYHESSNEHTEMILDTTAEGGRDQSQSKQKENNRKGHEGHEGLVPPLDTSLPEDISGHYFTSYV